jgi:hypothetical protein
MDSVLKQIRAKASSQTSLKKKSTPKMSRSGPVKTSYVSLPVPIPDSFLAPLADPSTIKVSRIDFANSVLPEYRKLYAVVLDNVLSQEECDELIRMAEMSAGAHRGEDGPENNGWKPAMVNVGGNYEMLATDYRNSDRIIWDEKDITTRLWRRVLQGEGMKEYLLRLDGKKYIPVVGDSAINRGECWVATKQGLNERMRFLKYGAGQYFRGKLTLFALLVQALTILTEHCDGSYVTPDGTQSSFYTIHLYFNDSAQELGIPEPSDGEVDPKLVDSEDKPAELLRGGATTFHSTDGKHRLDVNPKAGRVLIFQHRRLLHSGDDVQAGIK